MFEEKQDEGGAGGRAAIGHRPFAGQRSAGRQPGSVQLSRAGIRRKRGAWWSKTCDSLNGTFVNDMRVERATLQRRRHRFTSGNTTSKSMLRAKLPAPSDGARKAGATAHQRNHGAGYQSAPRNAAAGRGHRRAHPICVWTIESSDTGGGPAGKPIRRNIRLTSKLTVIGKSNMATVQTARVVQAGRWLRRSISAMTATIWVLETKLPRSTASRNHRPRCVERWRRDRSQRTCG